MVSGQVTGVAAVVKAFQAGVRQLLGKLSRALPGHQHVVSVGDQQRWLANAGQRLKIRRKGLQSSNAAQQIVGRRKAGHVLAVVDLQLLDVGGNPVRRVEKQRLRLDVGSRAAAGQQLLAYREAARGMRADPRPGVHQRQAAQPRRLLHGQCQADQTTEGMTDQVIVADAVAGEQRAQLAGHGVDAVVGGQRGGALAGA